MTAHKKRDDCVIIPNNSKIIPKVFNMKYNC